MGWGWQGVWGAMGPGGVAAPAPTAAGSLPTTRCQPRVCPPRTMSGGPERGAWGFGGAANELGDGRWGCRRCGAALDAAVDQHMLPNFPNKWGRGVRKYKELHQFERKMREEGEYVVPQPSLFPCLYSGGGGTSLFVCREVLILKEHSDALVPWNHEERLVGLCSKASPGPGVLQGIGDAAAGACG